MQPQLTPPTAEQNRIHYEPERELSGRGRDALEIGCGNCGLLRRLAPQHRRYVGIGISVEALGSADIPDNARTQVAGR